MTETVLESWPRPLFVQLPLKGLTFFVIYGTLDASFPAIPRDAYRTLGLPDGIELTFHALDDRPELRAEFQQGAGWENFCRESPPVIEALKHSPTCITLRGETPDLAHLDRLRDCIGLIMFLLDQGGLAVCDALTGAWFTALDWRLKIFDEGMAAASSLVAFHSIAQSDGRRHLYTHGLRRFARPDLSMPNIPSIDEPSRLAIVHHLAQGLIAGGSIPDGQQLTFPELKTRLSCRWQGSLDDPNFYNFWLQLSVADS